MTVPAADVHTRRTGAGLERACDQAGLRPGRAEVGRVRDGGGREHGQRRHAIRMRDERDFPLAAWQSENERRTGGSRHASLGRHPMIARGIVRRADVSHCIAVGGGLRRGGHGGAGRRHRGHSHRRARPMPAQRAHGRMACPEELQGQERHECDDGAKRAAEHGASIHGAAGKFHSSPGMPMSCNQCPLPGNGAASPGRCHSEFGHVAPVDEYLRPRTRPRQLRTTPDVQRGSRRLP